MAGFAAKELQERYWGTDDDDYMSWWHSDNGIIVKYTVVGAIVVFIFGYVFGGYLHARSRMRKGLQPLAYHRCLVGRRVRPNSYRSNWPQSRYDTNPSQQQSGYYMNNMPPPPVYDPTRPPVYEAPPDGGSKIDPSQWRSEPTRRPAEGGSAPDYDAPSGPPPGASR